MASREAQCRMCGALLPALHARCRECGAEGKKIADPLVGRLLGGYTLRSKLAEGGIALIYEATRGEQRVAVKLLPHNNDRELNERFRREAAALAQLRHPFALKLYDQGETDELLWSAMEYLTGETLDAYLGRRGVLSLQETAEILSPICEIIEEAHQKGIIHRDLTPSNMMLAQRGGALRPTLLDFGFAWLKDAKTLTEKGAVSGTPQYMSPEQWRGLHEIDARSDIYSLGVIIYQCLSGRLPIEARGPLEWLLAHEKEHTSIAALIQLPAGLSSMIDLALSKESSARPSSAMELREALLASLA